MIETNRKANEIRAIRVDGEALRSDDGQAGLFPNGLRRPLKGTATNVEVEPEFSQTCFYRAQKCRL